MICTCERHTLPCSHEFIQDVLPQDAIPASPYGWQTPSHGCSHGKERVPEESSVRSNKVFGRIHRSKRAHHQLRYCLLWFRRANLNYLNSFCASLVFSLTISRGCICHICSVWTWELSLRCQGVLPKIREHLHTPRPPNSSPTVSVTHTTRWLVNPTCVLWGWVLANGKCSGGWLTHAPPRAETEPGEEQRGALFSTPRQSFSPSSFLAFLFQRGWFSAVSHPHSTAISFLHDLWWLDDLTEGAFPSCPQPTLLQDAGQGGSSHLPGC